MIKDLIKYSIVIPVYNEEKFIGNLLNDIDRQRLNLPYKIEVIVVDGGSCDNTVKICKMYNVVVLNSERGRGIQLLTGASNSNGTVLIFLHADLRIPPKMFEYLDHNFSHDTGIAAFRMKLDGNKMLYKFYSFFTRFDSIFSTFGDQGIVVTRSFYNEIGGFKDLPIMEDVDFLRRARKFKKVTKFNENIITSPRRFESLGVIVVQLKSMVYILAFLAGVKPGKLYAEYYRTRDDKKESDYNIRQISAVGKSKNPVGFGHEQ